MTFDLLVIDEASQIQPVDALGAIARAGRSSSSATSSQLPPTAFFAKMTAARAPRTTTDEGARVADIESILGLFTARGLPQRMLRWHYRSRHQSLIAVSNRQFYENKLFIVPSPDTRRPEWGCASTTCRTASSTAGATGTNPVEARTVAEAVIAHAEATARTVARRRRPSRSPSAARSWTSSSSCAGSTPTPRSSSTPTRAEPFFVKNLENVQGDERDVIFISVGYGRRMPRATWR